MAKFNTHAGLKSSVPSPVTTTVPAVTHQGGAGFLRDAQSELYLLSVSNMVSEKTFHEDPGERDDRFARLVQSVALEDPQWIQGMLPWLRTEGFMRSASVVGAAEAARTLCDEHRYAGVEDMIDGVLRRADEPGEFMAYWRSVAGRSQPKRYRPVYRGVARAVVRLYTEKNWLKWDSAKAGYRFADVIETVHPRAVLADPLPDWQNQLFKHIIDKRHSREGLVIPDALSVLANNEAWREAVRTVQSRGAAASKDLLEAVLDPEMLKDGGLTWEDVLSALGGTVDKKILWNSIIPSMGAMALTRNLRNFDEAGVPDKVAAQVAAKISDPEEVRRSKQFPFRYLAAYRHAPSLRWSYPLEQALGHSLANVPVLGGRTLVLVDRSGSMFHTQMSSLSDLTLADGAAIFGTALAMRAENATLVQFGTTNQEISYSKGGALLRILDKFGSLGGTNTSEAVRRHYRQHDRVVIVTDEQASFHYHGDPTEQVPANIPVYTWNLAGYRVGHGMSGSKNRHTFGGLSDASFRLIPLLERGRYASWPWEK